MSVSGIVEAARSTLNHGLKSSLSVFASAVSNALRVVQAQRHVHSATCSGLAAGFTGSPHAFPVKIDPVGVMDQAVEAALGRTAPSLLPVV